MMIKNLKTYMKNKLTPLNNSDQKGQISDVACTMNMTLMVASMNLDLALRQNNEQEIADHVFIIALLKRNLRYLQRLAKRYEN